CSAREWPATIFKVIRPPARVEKVFTCWTKRVGDISPGRWATINFRRSVEAARANPSTIGSGLPLLKSTNTESTPLCSASRQKAICAAISGSAAAEERRSGPIVSSKSPPWISRQWNRRGAVMAPSPKRPRPMFPARALAEGPGYERHEEAHLRFRLDYRRDLIRQRSRRLRKPPEAIGMTDRQLCALL